MAATVGSLNVDLSIGTARFKQGLSDSQAALNRSAAEMKATASRMSASLDGVNKSVGVVTASIKAAGAAVLAGLGVGAVHEMIGGALEYASSLGEVAQQLGVGTDALQAFRYVATQTGISQESMDASLGKLTRSIGEAAGGGRRQASAFAQLGVAVRDVNGEIRPTEDVLRDLVGAFSAIEDPAKRAKLEVALFGKAGQQLDTMLSGGVDQLDNMTDAARRLGIVLDKRLIDNADDAADKLSKVKMILQARIAGVVADNVDMIDRLSASFFNLAAAAGNAMSKMANFKDVQGYKKGDWAATHRLTQSSGGRASLVEAINERIAANRDERNSVKPSGDRLFDKALIQRLDKEYSSFLRQRAGVFRLEDASEKFGARAGRRNPQAAVGGSTVGGRAPSVSRGSGRRSARSVRGTDVDREASQLRSLYDRLYPDDAKNRQFLDDLALLEKAAARGGAEAEKASEAIRLLRAEAWEIEPTENKFSFPEQIGADLKDLSAEIGKFPVEVIEPTWDQVVEQNARMARSFVDAAQDARYALSSLSGAIKSGDLLDILDAGLRLFEIAKGRGDGSGGVGGLAKLVAGLRGGSKGIVAGDDVVQQVLSRTGFPRVPGMANGGSLMVGGLPGIDRNVLSINGTPRALVSASERTDVSPSSLRSVGGDTINITVHANDAVMTGWVTNEVQKGMTLARQQAVGDVARSAAKQRRRQL